MAVSYRIIFDDPDRCFDFFQSKQGFKDKWGAFTAIGIEINGILKGAVIYEKDYKKSITMHMAGEGLWLKREFLYYVFHYPFMQLSVTKCLAFVDTKNIKSIKLALHLGFKLEHIINDAAPIGDLSILSMTKDQCRFLEN